MTFRRTALLLIMLGIVEAFFTALVVYPSYQQWHDLAMHQTSLAAEIKTLRRQLIFSTAVAEQSGAIKLNAANALKFYPVDDQRESFLQAFDTLRSGLGLTVSSLNFLDTTTPVDSLSMTKSIQFSVILTGEYPSIRRLIAQLDTLPRAVNVTGISFKTDPTLPVMTASLDGLIYSRPLSAIKKQDQFDPLAWDYLDPAFRVKPIGAPTSGRANPYSSY